MQKAVKMHRYNSNHPSGVVAYGFAVNGIILQFAKGGYYYYDKDKPGSRHISNMKPLAERGAGLSTYISQHPDVRDNYKAKDNDLESLLKSLA